MQHIPLYILLFMTIDISLYFVQEFFFRLSFCNCKSCVFNCDDLLSYNSSLRSAHQYDFYIFITSITLFSLQKGGQVFEILAAKGFTILGVKINRSFNEWLPLVS